MRDAEHERGVLSTPLLDQQLADLLGPLGVRAEASEDTLPQSPSIELREGECLRITTHYLTLTRELIHRLTVTANVVTFLAYHKGDAACIMAGITHKGKLGCIVLAVPTPFPQSVLDWT